MSAFRPLLLFVACSGVLLAQPAPDPIEGKWIGQTGDLRANNSSLIGLEFTRHAAGELRYHFAIEQLNIYDIASPEAITRRDHHYTSPSFDLELKDDQLVGTFGSSKRAIVLKRTDKMPADAPLPADLPRGPGPKWRTLLGGAIYAAPTVHGDFAYVGTANGVMIALKIADGSVVWNFAAGRPIFGAALATDDALFFVCDNGYLFKLSRADGKELWRYDLGDARVSRILPDPICQPEDGFDHRAPSPVLADGVLYVGAGDGGFHAVRADTGERLWRSQAKGAIRATAVVRGAQIFFSTMAGHIVAADRTTGRELWRTESTQPITSAPAFVSDNLIIGGRDSELRALDPATGALRWKLGYWGSWVESTAVPAPENNGRAYIGSSDLRRVVCFDANEGRIVWRTDVFGSPWGRPLVTEKFVYAAMAAEVPYMIRHEGGLAALDRTTGKLVWRWPMPNPPGVYSWGFAGSPTRVGDLLLIGGIDGTLYAFPIE